MCAPVASTHTYTHLNCNAITALCHDPEYSLVQILQQLVFRFKSVVFLRIHRYMPFLIQLFDPPNLHRISGQSDSAQVGDALGDHHLHVWNLKLTFGSWRGNQAEINMVRLGIRVLDRLMVSTYGYFFSNGCSWLVISCATVSFTRKRMELDRKSSHRSNIYVVFYFVVFQFTVYSIYSDIVVVM